MELDQDKIMEFDLGEAYKYLRMVILEEEAQNKKQLKKALKQVRTGIKLPFHINDYLSENYLENVARDEVKIPDNNIRGKTHSFTQFYNEIEEREDTAKKALLDSIIDEDIIKPRDEPEEEEPL